MQQQKNRWFLGSCLIVLGVIVMISLIYSAYSRLIIIGSADSDPSSLANGARYLLPENTIPDRDIIFTMGSTEEHALQLGFINADGTGFETRYIAPELRPLFYTVFWGNDGDSIIFQGEQEEFTGTDYTYPIAIFADGNLSRCPEFLSPYSLQKTSSSYVTLRDSARSQSVLLDIETCQIIEFYDTDFPPLISSEQLIVIWEITGGFEVKDGDQILFSIPDGYPLAWSKDGQWLAYVDKDQNAYIINSDGSEQRKVTSHVAEGLRWSPDGKWLVFWRQTVGDLSQQEIYKVNVETGEEILLYEGGMFPDWRWREE